MPTNSKMSKFQLERKINKAILFVEKDKDTKSIYFTDKGLRLVFTNGFALIRTNYHSHVFSSVAKPYLYIRRTVEIAYDNECKSPDGKGYSFQALLDTLQKKEDKTEFNILTYMSWYLFNVFSPIYTIGESQVDNTVVFLDYAHNLAKNVALLSEHEGALTAKKFLEEYKKTFDELTSVFGDEVIIDNNDETDAPENDLVEQASEENQ